MDKKLKRVIGYSPTKVQPKAAPEIKPNPDTAKNEEVKESEPKIDLERIYELDVSKSKAIKDWIQGHPGFKWTLMCIEVGIDKGNFHRMLNSDTFKLSIKQIVDIEKILKDYGYSN